MEYVEGENMLSKFRSGKSYLNDHYGTEIAKVLKTIDIDFLGNASHFSQCLYSPSYEKLIAIRDFENELINAFETYNQWRKNGVARLVHGDFRDGNMIHNNGKITLIDPGPSLGHIATDFAYYITRSFISDYTSHLNSFIHTFLSGRNDIDLIRAVALLECSRIYYTFNSKNNSQQRKKVIEMMELISLGKMLVI